VVKQASRLDFGDSTRGAYLPWVPAMVGLGIVASLLLALLPLTGGDRPRAQAGDQVPPAVDQVPAPAVTTSASRAASADPSRPSARPRVPASPTPAASRAAVATPPRTAPRTAPPADVTGRYRVVASYPTEFIGEVLISNKWGSPRHWTVQLAFGDDVGTMQAFWMDAQPRVSVRRAGEAYVFTSTAPLAARTSAALRMRFERSGQDRPPAACTTNGLACG
jgi:hypothetical protein